MDFASMDNACKDSVRLPTAKLALKTSTPLIQLSLFGVKPVKITMFLISASMRLSVCRVRK